MKALKDRLTQSEPDQASLDRVWAKVVGPPRRSEVGPWRFATAGVSLALVLALAGWWRTGASREEVAARSTVSPPMTPPPAARLVLADGTELRSADTLVLTEGTVRVDATVGPADLRVRGVRVQALSARFVLRVAAEQVRVEVEAGEVSVTEDAVTRRLTLREVFESSRKGPVAWLPLARAGRFAEAADALGSAGRGGVAQAPLSAEDRLLFADVELAAGESAVALAQLDQVSASDAGADVRALAAWKRGLRLSERLGEEAAAARSFEHAIELGLPGVTERDAALRVAEAWAKAGDVERSARWRGRAGDAGRP